ncbi:MAG TPA: chemotaxis protein CheW [Baekduia sp.]|nr:chemotaxis protein CheW [Baekduia sp.]
MSEETLSRQLVVFSLGEEEYALPITQVHEIIRYAEPRSVASSDPSVRGVISLRGKILPVYDLATRLGIDRAESVAEAKIVIVETADDMAGVVVDDVEEVITIDGEQLDEAPTAGGRGIDGIAKIGDRLVVLLDPEGIIGAADASTGGEAADAAGETADLRAAA